MIVGKSRLEINITRLLSKCESMAKDSSIAPEDQDWRLEKFLITLDSMIKDLQKSPNPPSKDTISKYIRKVEFLKGLLETKKYSKFHRKSGCHPTTHTCS
uniref:Vesicle transport protein USE1 n=1 Tax=Clastoptera arizonana TaxID=38151 RepID=A0A1B6EF38_9HEMI